jgi:hypothetical protein
MPRMLSPITNGGIQLRASNYDERSRCGHGPSDEAASSNEPSVDPLKLRSGSARHARLEPSQMVICADLIASNQRFDRGQELPITNMFGVNLMGICLEDKLSDIVHLLLQQLNFGRIHTSARRSRFGQSMCETGQPVAPVGGATEFPAQFLDLRRVPRARRCGHRLNFFGHVAVRRMHDSGFDFAEQSFKVAAPTSRLQ